MTPNIFHKCKFVYSWRISGDGGTVLFDFLSYMLRPEAFEPSKHADEMEYVYSEFIPNEKSQAKDIKKERSYGAFTSTKDNLTAADLDKIRQQERASRSEGCPKYAGVISFDNAYLRENGFIVGNQLDRQALVDAARKGINAMIDKTQKLDASNCYWVGAIHVNTGNVHIHYQLVEYHRLEDRRITYKNRGQDDFEQAALDELKRVMTHCIDKSIAAQELTRFQRDVLAPSIKSEFAGSIQKINALIDKLPDDLKNSGNQWRYAKQSKPIKNEIQSCIRSVISENTTLSIMFDTYLHKLDEIQATLFRKRYGQNSRWANYKENELNGKNGDGKDGFYSRVGNSFLNICREYYMTKDKNIQIDNNIPEPKTYLSEKESEGFSEKNEPDYNNGISSQKSKVYLSENKKDDLEDAMPYDSLENSDIPDDLEMYLSSRNYDELYEPNAPDYSTDIFPQEPEAYLSENDKSDQAVERLRIDWSKNYKLALDYMYGNEQNKSAVIKKDPEKAFEILSVESKSGNILATYDIGKLYDSQMLKSNDGDTLSQQYYSKAFVDFHKLLSIVSMSDDKRDNWTKSYLNYRIGKMCEYSLGKLYLSQERYDKAVSYLERSAAKDNYYAAYTLGKLYQEQFNDNALAEKHLMHAAEHKDDVMGTAAYRLGKLYLSFQDKRKALQYFIKAADKDNVYGMYAAGKILLDSRKSTEVSKGIRYLSSAADKDFEPAIYTLGKYYSSFNNTKAKEYLKRSAFEYNDPNAQYILGKVYLSENKNEMAEKCFRQCALNGNNSGQLAYGLMLLRDGQKKAAYQWLRKSARSGNDIAKKIISGKKADIPFEFRLAGCMQAQRTLLHKSSSMLRNALKSEEAKTARLMREFEIEQEMAKAKEQYHSI